MERDQILLYSFPQGLVFLQRLLGHPVVLHVIPDKFIGIQVRRVGRQKMQFQPSGEFHDVLFDEVGLVRRMSVHHQQDFISPSPHEIPEKLDKALRVELARVSGGPKAPAGGDRADDIDALSLPGALHHGRRAF